MDIKVLHREILMGPMPGSSGTETLKYFISHFYHKNIILPQILKQYRSIHNKKCKVFSDSYLPTFRLRLSPEITTDKLVQDICRSVQHLYILL